MYRTTIATPWVTAADDPSLTPSNHPLLADEYELHSWTDVTGQDASTQIVPAPNEYTVEVKAEEEVIAAIESDTDYTVLWSEEIIEGPV